VKHVTTLSVKTHHSAHVTCMLSYEVLHICFSSLFTSWAIYTYYQGTVLSQERHYLRSGISTQQYLMFSLNARVLP